VVASVALPDDSAGGTAMIARKPMIAPKTKKRVPIVTATASLVIPRRWRRTVSISMLVDSAAALSAA